ncbi:putative acid phosphatase 5 [Brevipalpus obovatus]|uniref:putative acid phosphatase 5 n=1 Tax=Brevipalpus obovatus TaxID=246614 RepID=UPI003D9F9DE8
MSYFRYQSAFVVPLTVTCFIFSSLSTQVASVDTDSLKGLILLVSSGHTSIKNSFPNDLYADASYWPDGLDELTIDGKDQMYSLGQAIASRYEDFLPDNPHQVYIKSYDDDSCLESAEVLAASVFPPQGRWDWNENLKWQPIAVHSFTDDILGTNSSNTILAERVSRIGSSAAANQILLMHQNLLSIIQEQTGWNPVNITNILTLHDVLNTETFASLTLPAWLNDTLMNELRQTAAELAHLIYGDEVVQKIVSSPLFNQIGTFTKSISSSIQSEETSSSSPNESESGGDDSNQPKVFILTMKQEKLLSFIATSKLNSSYLIYPSEGSCIAIEISKDASKGSYFNIVYKSGFNMSQDWQPLQSAYCEESDCPMADLVKLIQSHESDKTDFSGISLSDKPVPPPKQPSPSPSPSDHSAFIYDKLDDLYPINGISPLKARSSSGWNIFMIVVLCIAAAIIVLLAIGMLISRQNGRRRNDYDYL